VILTPNFSNPVAIIVYDGNYHENVNLVSNTYLFGYSFASVIIGNVSYYPSTGVNAQQGNDQELVIFQNMSETGDFTMNSLSKTSPNQATFVAITSFLGNSQSPTTTTNFIANMRVNSNDSIIMDPQCSVFSNVLINGGALSTNGMSNQGTLTLTNTTGFLFNAFQMDGVTVSATGTSLFGIGSFISNNINVENYGTIALFGSFCDGTTTMLPTGSIGFTEGCYMNSVISTTGTYINITNSAYGTLSTPGGAIDRILSSGTTTTNNLGVSTVTFPTYSTTSYSVSLTQSSGIFGSFAPVVSNKTTSSFVVNGAPTTDYDWIININDALSPVVPPIRPFV
jgi:hypothetical protein